MASVNMLTAKLDFWVKHNKNVLFIGKHGVGKCLGKGTPVILFNGQIVTVESIKVGDLLMGPDSRPREVLSIARGVDEMFKVSPTKGDSFICNAPHVLTLKMAGCNEAFDMPLNEFLCKNKTFQRRAMLFRVGVNFECNKELPEPPYMLGLWLGDGTKAGTGFSTTEEEILGTLCNYANENQLVLNCVNKKETNIDYRISSGIVGGKGLPREGRNKFLTFLKKHNLVMNKHIPHKYLTASEKDRLELLAGLIDTDGDKSNNCLCITQKSSLLTQDILFLARSLGFAAYASPCVKSHVYKGIRKTGNYFRITISGDIGRVPCQLTRKIGKPRKQIKNVLNTGIKSIKSLGKDDYYGFTLDGDGRFLLGDFTVTHNTAMVKDTFDRHGLKWRYFSASTMDPWVDFIGVPREKTENKIPEQFEIIKELASLDINIAYEWVQKNWNIGNDSAKRIVDHAMNREQGLTYLDLVRPQTFAAGEVEALFFDEYNRSPKKVRNAVMELIQFKSINGMKFPNLRIVWAAINPDEDENETYDVERLDPAQADRYHVTVEVPYRPNADWFRSEYGQRIGDAAIQWWDDLSDPEKNLVSPRRLQYALDVYRERGDVRDVLPYTTNVSKLTTALNTGPITEKIEALMKSKDATEARSFLQNENNYSSAMKFITKSETLITHFIPLLPKEKIAALMNEDDKMSNYIINNTDKVPVFHSVCQEIFNANTNARLVKKIRRTFTENQELGKAFASDGENLVDKPFFFNKLKGGVAPIKWSSTIQELKRLINDKMLGDGCCPVPPDNSRSDKLLSISIYQKIEKNIPEQQTADDSLATLEVLDSLFREQKFASNIINNDFKNLIGIVNHCLSEIKRTTGSNWEEIVKRHSVHFRNLLQSIKDGGLANQLYRPK